MTRGGQLGSTARVAVLSLAVSACAGPPHQARQPITLIAEEAPGIGVAGTRFWADGEELGESNVDGRLTTQVSGPLGHRVTLSAACPPGHEGGTERRAVTLRRAAPGGSARALEMRVRCRPLQQLAALVVRATGAFHEPIPIRVREEVVGQLDEDGVAHVVLTARPGSNVRVTLDTGSLPQLTPGNPTRTFHIGAQPEVLLFDQPFASARPRGRRRWRRLPEMDAPISAPRPYRLR